LFRNPQAVHLLKSVMSEIWHVATTDLQANYETFRQSGDPLTFEEFVARSGGTPAKSALLMLQEIIDNKSVGPTITKMHWVSVSLEGSELPLLTSDRPLYMEGLGNKDAHITLPVAPRMIFVAAHDDKWAKRLRSANPTKVVKVMNLGTVARARKYVWGIDDSQRRFVEKNMSRSDFCSLVRIGLCDRCHALGYRAAAEGA
jgi:hypothetical protein